MTTVTRDEIIKLAREAGLERVVEITETFRTTCVPDVDRLERFATLVAAAEREVCAAICDHYDHKHDIPEVRWCAEDIRARGKP